jgi:4-amino-4-deoxy-L-arabinose transferase-like glycosyltransferase
MTLPSEKNFHEKVGWGLVFLLVILVLFTGLGRLPLIDRDEGEYTTVAQEMIDRNDYVIPHVNGRQYFEKPVLYFWLTAASFRILGRTETAARLPSAFGGAALVLLLGWFARRRGGPLQGVLTALFTLATFMMALLARVALVDMLMTLFTTASLVFFYQGYRTSDKERRYFYAGWAAMSLAFLTKGPVGVIVILITLIPLAILNRNLLATLKRVRIPGGLLVFFLISGPWYLMAFYREGRLFWEGFFVGQNVRRYTEVLLGHGPPIWYFLPVLAVFVWPWFFFSLPKLWQGLVKNTWAQRDADESASLDFFLAIWFITNLVFFSLGATKLPHYILPAVPALVILAARWWDDYLSGASAPSYPVWLLIGTVSIGFLLSLFLMTAPFLAPMVMEPIRAGISPDSSEYAFPDYPPDLGWETLLVGAILLLLSLTMIVIRVRKKPRPLLVVTVAAPLVLIVGLTHLTAPKAFDYLQAPAKKMALDVRQTVRPDDRLAAFGLYKPTLWFYTQRHIERIYSDHVDKLSQYLASEGRVFLLTRQSLLPVLEQENDFRLLAIHGGYVFGDNQGRRP